MRAVHAIYVAIFLVSSSGAHATAERRGPERSARLLTRLRTPPTAGDPPGRRPGAAQLRHAPGGIEHARPAMDPKRARAHARRVLGARLRLVEPATPVPELERNPAWFELPDPAPRKEFRPKVMLHPMGFSTGGGGVKVKLRY